MGSFIFIIIFFIALASSGAMGSRIVYQGFSNLNPGKAKVEGDFRKLQESLKEQRPSLVPWSDAERALLSLKTKPYKEKTGNLKSAEGTIISIYHEPMVLFSYKRYLGKKEDAILVILTSHHEYLYRLKKGRIEVAYNGKYFGSITPQMTIVSENKKTLAQINVHSSREYYPILIRGKEIGTIGDYKRSKKVNPRAFEILSELSPDDEKILLALALYFLARNSFQKI